MSGTTSSGADRRIADIRVHRLRAPWIDAPRWSPSYDRLRELIVVEVETAGGIVGMGYLQILSGGMETIATCVEELVKPHALGRDVTEVEVLWEELWRSNYWIGRMGVTVLAQSALDIALWDATARVAGLPLFRLWGGAPREIAAYGSGCWRGLGGDGMVDKAKRYVERGFRAIKMQAGHLYDDRTDIAHVSAMRAALGETVDICIDVNMGWTVDQAIAVGRKFQDHGVYWLEEPVDCEDVEGYFRIADALDLRVVGGETHFTRYDLRPFFAHPKIPILQPDVMRGGFTELRRIAAMAESAGMRIAPHLFPELMVQLMAAIPNAHWIEYVDWMEDAWVEPILPERGTYVPPERPGHGLVFKPEFLAEYRIP
ncbi:MAG: mandelate racemase/muconate lactonizing enzyme family protein [Thalassobaculum sp.]